MKLDGRSIARMLRPLLSFWGDDGSDPKAE